jgi:hypothetical protein
MSIFEMVSYGYLCGVVVSFIFFVYLALQWNGDHTTYLSYYLGVTLHLQPVGMFLFQVFILSLLWLFVLVCQMWTKVTGK